MLRTGLWTQPRAVVRSVVEHNIGQAREAVLLFRDTDQFFGLRDTFVLLEVGFFASKGHRRVGFE